MPSGPRPPPAVQYGCLHYTPDAKPFEPDWSKLKWGWDIAEEWLQATGLDGCGGTTAPVQCAALLDYHFVIDTLNKKEAGALGVHLDHMSQGRDFMPCFVCSFGYWNSHHAIHALHQRTAEDELSDQDDQDDQDSRLDDDDQECGLEDDASLSLEAIQRKKKDNAYPLLTMLDGEVFTDYRDAWGPRFGVYRPRGWPKTAIRVTGDKSAVSRFLGIPTILFDDREDNMWYHGLGHPQNEGVVVKRGAKRHHWRRRDLAYCSNWRKWPDMIQDFQSRVVRGQPLTNGPRNVENDALGWRDACDDEATKNHRAGNEALSDHCGRGGP